MQAIPSCPWTTRPLPDSHMPSSACLNTRLCLTDGRSAGRVLALGLCLLAAPWVHAQAVYRVVGADGSVSYSDRPSAAGAAARTAGASANAAGRPRGANGAASGPVTPAATAASAQTANFPPELQRAVQRYPVTLYTTNSCAPCDGARTMLNTRGVPFTEKRVVSEDDAQAFERMFSGRSVPAITIGPQALKGYAEADWVLYLDAAAYPKRSQLPPGYTAPAVLPMLDRTTPVGDPTPPPSTPSRPNLPPPAAPTPGGIRF